MGRWIRRIQLQVFATPPLRYLLIVRRHPVGGRNSSRVSKSVHGLELHPSTFAGRLWHLKRGYQALSRHLDGRSIRRERQEN